MPVPAVVAIGLIASIVGMLSGLQSMFKEITSGVKKTKGDREETIALLNKATTKVKPPWKKTSEKVKGDIWTVTFKDSKVKTEVLIQYNLKTGKSYFASKSGEKAAKWKTQELKPATLNKMLKVWQLVKKDPEKNSGKLA